MANFPFQRLQIDLAGLIERTPAGQRLPSEPVLAKQLGVSRAMPCARLKRKVLFAAGRDQALL
jgi:hypothetical protein